MFRKDRHLSSALVVSEIDYMFHFKDNTKALKKEHRLIFQEMARKKTSFVHPETFYSWYMDKILSAHPVRSTNSVECHTLLRMAVDATEISRKDWTGMAPPTKVNSHRSHIEDI